MTPKEQEIQIKELEERVDRLRNLYEQYFLGFERLEPTVPRKDVDRRLAIMRKEQIRNTAMRFRFNVITQKYNTYAMHWIRICRQIEEGTYKRHVRRAKARFGDVNVDAKPDYAIDIDVGDFDIDMDEVLAEANASASDTVPPPPSARSPSARGLLDESEPRTPPPFVNVPSERALRPAALPAGSRARVVLRKREDGDLAPSSARALSVAPSSTRMVPSAPSSAGMPASVQSPGAEGASRIPIAAPASNANAPSAGRVPVAAPTHASSGRHAVAPLGDRAGPQIRPLGSGARQPVAAPGSPLPPGSPPVSAPGSVGRVPAAPARPRMAPASSPRLPGALPLPPGAPAAAGSVPRVPIGPDSSPTMAAPPKARAPVPLPSQSVRPPPPPKKE